jgi:hypothetical protein
MTFGFPAAGASGATLSDWISALVANLIGDMPGPTPRLRETDVRIATETEAADAVILVAAEPSPGCRPSGADPEIETQLGIVENARLAGADGRGKSSP